MNKFIVFILLLPLIKSQQIENLDGEYNLNEMEDYSGDEYSGEEITLPILPTLSSVSPKKSKGSKEKYILPSHKAKLDLIKKGKKSSQYISPKTKSKGNSSSLEYKNSVFTDNNKSREGIITASILGGVFLSSTIGFLVIRRNRKRNGMKLINTTNSYKTYDSI